MHLFPEQFNSEIISDRYNKIIFERGEEAIFLVGGYIRDIMAGRKSQDRDYVVSGQLNKVLKRIALRTKGKIVPIGKKGLYRIVTEDGTTLDFSRLDKDIGADLLRRDFTINSMAWSPATGIIDNLGSIRDFSNGLIRMVRPESLAEDPVRIIRAYRLADEFSFRIETLTRQTMKVCKNRLKESTPERITLEFFKILNSQNALSTLLAMTQDEILDAFICCDYERLFSKIKVISIFYEIINNLPLKYKQSMNVNFSEALIYRGLLILEIILRGGIDSHLRLSAKIQMRLRKYGLAEQIFLSAGHITPDVLFDIFETAGESAIDFLLTMNRLEFLQDYDRFLDINKNKLLEASEIKAISGVTRGAQVGRIIQMVKKAQFTKQIHDKTEAEQFVRTISYST